MTNNAYANENEINVMCKCSYMGKTVLLHAAEAYIAAKKQNIFFLLSFSNLPIR